jgi:hypothetical protein
MDQIINLFTAPNKTQTKNKKVIKQNGLLFLKNTVIEWEVPDF